MPEPELQEVVLVQEEDKKEVKTAPKENPFGIDIVSESTWKEMTQGVTLPALAGGLAGAFATGLVPRMVKWDTGWKDVAASLATVLVGGLVIGKMNKVAAYGFVLGGGIVTGVKLLRMTLGAKVPELKVLGDGLGASDLIYGVGADEYDEFFGADSDVFTEEELFGIGEDPIIPTADADY